MDDQMEPGKNWSRDRIRYLRLRLGWSCSDLARRLNCHTSLIQSWEEGVAPEDYYLQSLEMLSGKLEEHIDEITRFPQVDALLQESLLEQIHSKQFDP